MDADEDIRACFIGNTLPLCHIRVLTAAQRRILITGENDLRAALLQIFRQLFCNCEVQYFSFSPPVPVLPGSQPPCPASRTTPHAHHGKRALVSFPSAVCTRQTPMMQKQQTRLTHSLRKKSPSSYRLLCYLKDM